MTNAIDTMIRLGKRLRLYALRGEWRDIGRPADLEAVAGTLRTSESTTIPPHIGGDFPPHKSRLTPQFAEFHKAVESFILRLGGHGFALEVEWGCRRKTRSPRLPCRSVLDALIDETR